MHAVRTPLAGITLAVLLLIVENLGARAYIAERIDELSREDRVIRCTAIERSHAKTITRY